MKKHLIFILVLLLIVEAAITQDFLTIKQAIDIGLENNYGIRLGKQDLSIAENNNTYGNAGFLPRLNVNAAQTNSVTNSHQAFLTGQVNDRSGAKSDAFNAGLQLNWTIFDGLKMFARRDQLQQLEEMGEMQLLLTVENTITSIHVNYFTLVQLMKQKKVLEKTITIGNERLALADDKLTFGSGSKLEVLQALVDLHSDSAAYMNLLDQISRNTIAINTLLGRAPEIMFAVDDQIELRSGLVYDSLEKQLLQRNTSLLLSKKDEQLAQLALKEIKARQYPEIGLNVGYNFLNQKSESGFLAENRSLGLTYGLTASMNLFNGLNTQREQKNLRVQIESNRLQVESLQNELIAELKSSFSSYSNKLKLRVMESHNLTSAQENLKIAGERFELGDLSGIEFREAQRNYLEAETRLLLVILEIKILETHLLQLAGMLTTA
jgi:outer membrane protein TolC